MCQIENIDEMDSTDFFEKSIERLLYFLKNPITFMVIIKGKTKRYKTPKIKDTLMQNKKHSEKRHLKDLVNSSKSNLNVGDIVRIRSKEQILQTLDNNNKLEGCLFMEDMWQYCGTEHKVLKKVNYFYDEANRRMCKAYNTVLLEGIYCSGKFQRYNNSCDRFCLLFWKEDWIEKI